MDFLWPLGSPRLILHRQNARAVDNIPALLGHDETEAQDDAASAGGSCDRVWVTTSHDPKIWAPKWWWFSKAEGNPVIFKGKSCGWWNIYSKHGQNLLPPGAAKTLNVSKNDGIKGDRNLPYHVWENIIPPTTNYIHWNSGFCLRSRQQVVKWLKREGFWQLAGYAVVPKIFCQYWPL